MSSGTPSRPESQFGSESQSFRTSVVEKAPGFKTRCVENAVVVAGAGVAAGRGGGRFGRTMTAGRRNPAAFTFQPWLACNNHRLAWGI
ncbi:MAG TPA: hypothetical protein VGC77_19425 [Rhodopseudomonas sp.]|uniref:hypothetical protein n=1 Tax=Rhodopseudomonas sp. TaxID=1078 RepID=UPI002EDB3B8F